MAPRVHAANAPVLERMLKATGAIGNDNFTESEHPVFRGTSPLARESLKKVREQQKCRYTSMRNPKLQELLFRTVLGANQLRIHGAVAYGCNGQHEQATEFRAEPRSEVVPPDLIS